MRRHRCSPRASPGPPRYLLEMWEDTGSPPEPWAFLGRMKCCSHLTCHSRLGTVPRDRGCDSSAPRHSCLCKHLDTPRELRLTSLFMTCPHSVYGVGDGGAVPHPAQAEAAPPQTCCENTRAEQRASSGSSGHVLQDVSNNPACPQSPWQMWLGRRGGSSPDPAPLTHG